MRKRNSPPSLFRTIKGLVVAPFLFIGWMLSLDDLREALNIPAEDSSFSEVVDKVKANPGELLEHIAVLRRHLLRTVLCLAITTAAAFTFIHAILEFLARPLEGGLESLVAIEVTEPVGTVMRVSLVTGFAFSFPYIAYQIWLYVAPAIIERRRRINSLLAIPLATLFYLGGMAFAYYLMLPTALPFLLNFMGISTIPRPSSYITFVTGIMFWIGIAFEFPLVIFFLASLGVVKSQMLREQWRLAIVIIVVIAAVITPTVDPINMFLVAGPLAVLYFLSIFLAMIAGRARLHRASTLTRKEI